ncbi:Kinesin motor domain/Microtubule binding, putative [Angomonas deanei]|uniref:Kinesin motor domain/Microtubule binding, putative n=1 Tax=Angomonas deanei TaxID=59799 RepID=A0A7G2CSZ6_9TRYP|nr:Kinesin motor domain/Microtubule binding, putative [Angomonas deanei]
MGSTAHLSPTTKPISARVSRPHHSDGKKNGASGTLLTLWGPRNQSDTTEEQRRYEFGQVFEPEVSDESVCSSIVPSIMEQLSSGFNTCVLCYGQTGSGKTHTINALVPQLTQSIMEWMDSENDVLEISYIQIYNNKAYDLLGVSDKESLGAPLPKPTTNNQTLFEPRYLVESAAEVKSKINGAQFRRCTASHELNARSSRSHTLLSFNITKHLNGVPLSTIKVTLADLAGTERVKKSGVHGTELGQAIAINKSLLALHTMIRSTPEDTNAKPYGDLLTQYVAPRLKEWHLILIVTASLEKTAFSETKSSLDFASTAKKCEVTKCHARSDVSANEMQKHQNLASVVDELKFQVSQLQEQLLAERQRQATPQPASPKSFTPAGSEGDLQQDKQDRTGSLVVDMEAQHAYLMQLLKEKEEELENSLVGGSDDGEEEHHSTKTEKERRVVDELFEELKSKRLEDSFEDALESLKNSFLCVLETLNSAREQNAVQLKSLNTLRADKHKMEAKLSEYQTTIRQHESKNKELQTEVQTANADKAVLLTRLEETEFQINCDAVDRAVREECLQLYEVKNVQETKEMKQLQKQLAEQMALYDNQQARLSGMEKELHDWQEKKTSMEENAATTTQTMAAIWAVLTQQQKLQFFSGSGSPQSQLSPSGRLSTGGDVLTAKENLNLQKEVRDLRRQLEKVTQSSKEKDYIMEDLREKLKHGQRRLDRSNENYNGLLRLEETLASGKELMEQQMVDYNAYMDSHIVQLGQLKMNLITSKAEGRNLRTELDSALREKRELEVKIHCLNEAQKNVQSERALEQDLWLEERDDYENRIENLENQVQELNDMYVEMKKRLSNTMMGAYRSENTKTSQEASFKTDKDTGRSRTEAKQTKIQSLNVKKKKRASSSSVARPSHQDPSDTQIRSAKRVEKKAPPDVIVIRSVSPGYR